jgi:hypothetical protein
MNERRELRGGKTKIFQKHTTEATIIKLIGGETTYPS